MMELQLPKRMNLCEASVNMSKKSKIFNQKIMCIEYDNNCLKKNRD